METEYIIKENEIGIKFVDGKLDSILKPGRYKVGINQKEIFENIQKAKEAKENFMEQNFTALISVEPSLLFEIKNQERKLNRTRGLGTTLIKSFRGLFTTVLTSSEDAAELKHSIRQLKASAYADNSRIPEKIREKLVEFDKKIEDAAKEPQVIIDKLDMRQLSLLVAGQEMLTNDKVPIRINVISQYRIIDPKKAAISVVSYQDRLYQQIQMVVRDYASANTLDQLLTNKSTISKYVKENVKELAESIGLEVIEVGLKDIILPGEIQSAMNKVFEAERQGKASFVKAREEVAAARAMANAAKIITSDPAILTLKQLETLKEIAKSPSATIYFGVGDDIAKALYVNSIDTKKKKA